MIKFTVKKKEYVIKFGHKAVAKSGVTQMITNVEELTDSEDVGAMISALFEAVAVAVLVGLQKTEKKFSCDFNDKEDYEAKLDMVYDLLDDYLEEEDSMSDMELFTEISKDLFNSGFFKKTSPTTEEMMTEMDSTVTPIDHLKKK